MKPGLQTNPGTLRQRILHHCASFGTPKRMVWAGNYKRRR